MPEEKKLTPRLPKAASEFNVSQERVIDILTKNGFEINNPSPNMKLTVEMYQCLQKELAKDKMVKEKSDQKMPQKAKKRSLNLRPPLQRMARMRATPMPLSLKRQKSERRPLSLPTLQSKNQKSLALFLLKPSMAARRKIF